MCTITCQLGIALNGCADWVAVDSIRRTMDVNYFGVVAVTKALLPLLKKCPESRIVTVSSLAGRCATLYAVMIVL